MLPDLPRRLCGAGSPRLAVGGHGYLQIGGNERSDGEKPSHPQESRSVRHAGSSRR